MFYNLIKIVRLNYKTSSGGGVGILSLKWLVLYSTNSDADK